MAEGFHVDLAALDQAARGVDGIVHQVAAREVASPDGVLVGHARLATALSGFCDRWNYGLATLAHDVEQVSARLDGCVAAYRAADRAAQGQLSGSGPDPAAGAR